jgi:formylglycine-generating enzyme required for sulfatase activity
MLGSFRFSFLFFTIIFSYSAEAQMHAWHSIPERQIILNELFPGINSSVEIKIKVKEFELSQDQVSLASYKIFLNDMRKDSGELVYQSLLPDTNIGPKEVRDVYFNSGKYDDYPVVGISWENALKYCRWMTLKSNPDSLKVIYRLPNLYEYYSAYTYMQSAAINNSLNGSYADWLMDVKDESAAEMKDEIPLSYYYFHLAEDPPVMKRKMVIGKSFLYSFHSLEDYLKFSYYGNEGYRHIGFRLVKDTDAKSFMLESNEMRYENPLLKYWKLKPKSK